MNFTKKFDRAFQWAGEKMGQEAKTGHSDEFKMLETEMALRHDGMDRLQKSMNAYVKSLSRRSETFEDKEKGLPVSYLGRTMISHGEDFEPDSEFGNCLIAMGRANERVAGIQETYITHATSYWLEGLERSLAMMKEYQSARKKLEHRRLAYDSSMTKMHKAKKEDFRLEDELRASKAKYEESSEDVFRRMQDIKEAEADSVRDLTGFLECELDYYERCADELRRAKQEWVASTSQLSSGPRPDYGMSRRPTARSRSNTAPHSYADRNDRTERWANRQDIYEEEEPAPEPVRMPIRSSPYRGGSASPESSRPTISRATTYGSTFEGPASRQSAYREPPPPPLPENNSLRKTNTVPSPNVSALRNNLRPVSRIQTNQNLSPDIYNDDCDTTTSSGSPEYDRSESPATSYGSLSRSTSNTGLRTTGAVKKAPPPPPPSRAKKPAPPIPAKRDY
ncbi:BAR-domain-containing protein [Xylariaceae sp. FL0662B]|nr:BAR-domain-containing protein [Xylariaceae sp. FL0662B]